MSSNALALRVAARVAAASLALLVGACSTLSTPPGVYSGPVEPPAVGGTPGVPEPGAPPAPPAAPVSPLVSEQRFFEDWFHGTPVVIAARPESTLQVDVPLVHSFETGKADIKPALAAVLERVAESLKRQIGARVAVAAPPDPGGSSALAQQRAERVREHLVSRRIAAPRIVVAQGARAGTALQLRMTIPPAAFPAVSRLHSPNIVTQKGVAPVSTARPAGAGKR